MALKRGTYTIGSTHRFQCERDDIHERFYLGNDADGYWSGTHDFSLETVHYTSKSHSPHQHITAIEYEGWRRHIPERQQDEGIRIRFLVRNLQSQAELARCIDTKIFQKLGWLEPLVAEPKAPYVVVNFREALIEHHPTYLDDLFHDIAKLDSIPSELIADLKAVIAHNCLFRFCKHVHVTDIAKAQGYLRTCALYGVDSPFYLAAQFCVDHSKLPEARTVIQGVRKDHWQFDEALNFEREIAEREVHSLRETIARMHWRELYPNFSDQSDTLYNKRPQYPKGLNLQHTSIVKSSFEPGRRLENMAQHFTLHAPRSISMPSFPAVQRFSVTKSQPGSDKAQTSHTKRKRILT